jgi:positive regulator of sigma E activity
MRRLLVSASLAYLLVAFGFIILTLLNASTEGSLVIMGEGDAGVIFTLSLIGIVVTLLLALRILIDGKRRQDLERQIHEPRRRSDLTRPNDTDRSAPR